MEEIERLSVFDDSLNESNPISPRPVSRRSISRQASSRVKSLNRIKSTRSIPLVDERSGKSSQDTKSPIHGL
jgi:hypothetical protein